MLRIVVCVSGGGTNLQAIIDGVKNGQISNTEIVQVISNNGNAYALKGQRRMVSRAFAYRQRIMRIEKLLTMHCWKL